MNLTIISVILAITAVFSIIYVIILSQKNNKLKLDINHSNRPAQELNNYQKEVFELKKSELQLKNSYDEKLSELKVKYERELNILKVDFEKEKNVIKENSRKEKQDEYQKGYDKGVSSSNMTVHVTPYKEITKDDSLFFKEDIVLLGYKYQLFSNGMPCFNSHIEISDQLYIKELKQENVQAVISGIEQIISKIPNPNIQLIGNMKDFSKGVLSLNKN